MVGPIAGIEPLAKRANITKRIVDALQPQAVRYDVFDGALRGFHVRVHPSGAKVYRLKYRSAGKQLVMTVGEHGAPWTAEAARSRAEVLRGVVKDGGDPVADKEARQIAIAESRRRALTVGELVEKWLTYGRAAAPNKRDSSWAHDASRLRRHIVPLLGVYPASSLRRADIEKAQQDILEGKTAADVKTKKRGRAIIRGGRAVARGAIVSLSSCYSWAVAQELVADNPVTKVKKLAPTKRERFLSEKEAAALLDALNAMEAERSLPKYYADAIRLLLLTGARKREITELEWSEIDLKRGLIKLPPARSKTGEKLIHLSAPAAAILSACPQGERFVFPAPTDPTRPAQELQKAWQRVRSRAGLASLRLHDLRHSYASFAVAGGASLTLIGKALGHAQVATTARYAHLGEDPVKQMTERVGQTIMGSGKRNNDEPTVLTFADAKPAELVLLDNTKRSPKG